MNAVLTGVGSSFIKGWLDQVVEGIKKIAEL